MAKSDAGLGRETTEDGIFSWMWKDRMQAAMKMETHPAQIHRSASPQGPVHLKSIVAHARLPTYQLGEGTPRS